MGEEERAEDRKMKHERGAQEEGERQGPYFQLVPSQKEETESEKLKEEVRALEGRLEALGKRKRERVSALERNDEESPRQLRVRKIGGGKVAPGGSGFRLRRT